MIDRQEILDLSREWGLRPDVVEKDYVLGWVLAGIFGQLRQACLSTFLAVAVLQSIATQLLREPSASKSLINIHSEISKLALPVFAAKPRWP